jgi:hypothetical protein
MNNNYERNKRYEAFLKAHPELKSAQEAILAMKRDGVIAKSTYWMDCRYVLNYFGEARS